MIAVSVDFRGPERAGKGVLNRSSGHHTRYTTIANLGSEQWEKRLSPSRLSHLQLKRPNGKSLDNLPTCATNLLRACRMEHLEPTGLPMVPAVEHAYLVAWSADKLRGTFQRMQLPALGLSVTVMLGYDADDLTDEHRECLFVPGARNTTVFRPKYQSQNNVMKLFAALLNMVDRSLRNALIFEDDAIVHFDRLPALNAAAAAAAANNFSIIHLSSYNPAGVDGMRTGFHPKALPYVNGRPTLMMPGVANLLSLHGARCARPTAPHSLGTLTHSFSCCGRHAVSHGIPIVKAGLDMMLSDTRVPSAPQVGAYYLKPYPFTVGAFGSSNLFECRFDEACKLAFFRKWKRWSILRG